MKDVLTDYGIVDQAIVINFSRDHQVKFPQSYIDIITRHNGAQLTKSKFYYELNGVGRSEEFNFCGYGGWPVLENIENFQSVEMMPNRKIIVFGLTSSGNYLCFDYRVSPQNPKISVVLHDVFENISEFPTMKILEISEDFDEFLASLSGRDAVPERD